MEIGCGGRDGRIEAEDGRWGGRRRTAAGREREEGRREAEGDGGPLGVRETEEMRWGTETRTNASEYRGWRLRIGTRCAQAN